ncbi:putative reverse transcriptase domain-containing protein [Tanacetum coccineum]
MEEINNFQQEPEETLYQALERFKELLMKCPQYYFTEMQEVILFYNGLDVPTRQIFYSKGVVPTKIDVDAKKVIQEMAEYSQKWQNGTSRGKSTETSDGLATIQAQLNNLGRDIKKVLQERGFGSLHSSTKTNMRDQVKSISTTIEADSNLIRRIGSSQYAVSTGQNRTLIFEASHINNCIPRKEKDTGSFTLPCFINTACFDNALVDLGARVSVMPLSTYLNLGLGELAHTKLTVELADRTVKYPKGIAENVLVRIGKFTFPVDFIILDMLKDIKVPLILGRPFLSTAHAKIDVYKRKITLRVGEENIIFKSLRRNQGDDLMPTIEEGEVIEEFRTRDEDLDTGIDDYPRMGDVIFGEPFLREVGIKARRFDGMITIYNGDDEVTYQMVRSHPRFKNHTNEQCNKIPPLLKVSEEDMINGISHSYQKLKGFYKGVLNLGPDYIRDAKMEEWLTRGHISMHEME